MPRTRTRPAKSECTYPGCESTFTNSRDAQVHIEGKHFQLKRYICRSCKYASPDPSGIRRHCSKNHAAINKHEAWLSLDFVGFLVPWAKYRRELPGRGATELSEEISEQTFPAGPLGDNHFLSVSTTQNSCSYEPPCNEPYNHPSPRDESYHTSDLSYSIVSARRDTESVAVSADNFLKNFNGLGN